MSEDRSVLDVVENIDRKLDEKIRADEARFTGHEQRLDDHDTKFKEHAEEHRALDTTVRDQGALILKFGQAAASAVTHALEAKQAASQSIDEATKIVESAIRMHSASIATTVQQAVKAEIAPVKGEVDALKTSTKAQDTILKGQDDKLDALVLLVKPIAAAIMNRRLRTLLIVCACLGALGAGAVAGWKGHAAAKLVDVPTLMP